MTNLDSILKSRDIANKGSSSQGYGFSSGHVWMGELDCAATPALQADSLPLSDLGSSHMCLLLFKF